MFERRDENLPNQVMAPQISGAVELGHVEDLFGWAALKQTYATGGNGFSRLNAKTAVAHVPYRPQITIAQHSRNAEQQDLEAPAKSKNDSWNYRKFSPALLARQSREARQWTLDVLV
jgi:hypothetical protein